MSWLISKALMEAYANSPFSQALEAAFSAECSSDGAPYAQLSVAPTAQRFWHNDKPMESSRFSRFGLTYRALTADRGEALLTWFRVDFLARTSASREAVMASMVSAADSGFTWPASFAKYDPDTHSWRTRQLSLLGGLAEFSQTWPRWGSMHDGECSQPPTSELYTFERESGLLPTPCAIDSGSFFNQSESSGAALRPTLGAMARYDLWPTPTVKGNYNRKGISARSGDGLATAVRRFPTPTASMRRGSSRGALTRKNGRSRANDRLDFAIESDAHHGRLNPTWVEWLQGWPIGWTALQPLAMDKFHEWRQQHGASCIDDSNEQPP